jgi:predicted transposase/invertase (TIGR01784 family)
MPLTPIEPPRIVDPLTDFAFKRLLGTDESAPLLVAFLNAILRLPQPVVAVQLENPTHEREFPDDRSFVVDIRATDQQGRIFHIDVQLIAHTALAERVLFCWADGFARQLSKGNAYDELRPLISIWVTPAAWLPGAHHHSRFQPADLGQATVLTDRMEIHVLELAKWKGSSGANVTPEEGWFAFLRDGKAWDTLPSRYESQKELTMAMNVLRDIRDREWDLYSRQLDAWRTQQLIEADRQREAEYAKKLAREVAEMQAALSEKDAALSEKDAALSEKDAALSEKDAALSEKDAALSEAEARAQAAEATLARLLRDLGME